MLAYDLALPYEPPDGGRWVPRIAAGVEFPGEPSGLARVRPLLDTGAGMSILDGREVEAAGLPWREVVDRALDVKPIHGLSRGGRPVEGYETDVVCYLGTAARFAELRFRALVTPPDTIAFPVLGRAGFFDQVDVTFAHADRMLYLRFRNPALGRLFG